jgi:hypothetical protein
MNKLAIAAASLAVFGAATAAEARTNVGVGINLSSGGYYQPAPVYYRPAPVYYQPAPVYYQPAPVVYRPYPVYSGSYYGGYYGGSYWRPRGHERGYWDYRGRGHHGWH